MPLPTQVFDWHKRFKEGWDEVEDDPCSGQLPTIQENIKQVKEVLCKDCRLTIRAVAEIVGIDKELVRLILHDSFNF